ncbi:MAG: hypothetical protein R6X13_03560 [bacterium]
MADPTKRIAKWNVKFDTERVKAILDEMRPTMLERVNSVFTNIVAMETQVKQVLDTEGVPTINYPSYLSYGRELWRLTRKEISGTSMQLEALVLLNKWVARGLTQSVLEAIRLQVFNVSAPTI